MSAGVRPGTVYVVGAGPGDPDLLTVRARRVLEAADVVLYADSLVDPRLLAVVRSDAEVRGTSGMTLEPIVERMAAAARRGAVVARVHSGDPGVYGAIAEQLSRLEEAGVPWEVIPGVASPLAAAAALGCELTVPSTAQAVVFCRVAGRTPMPAGQDLRSLARPGVSLCVFLSAAYASELVAALRDGGVPGDTPAIVAERVSRPDERFSAGTVDDLEPRLRDLGIRRHALILVGPAFAGARRSGARSSLYDAGHAHVFRPAGAVGEPRRPDAVAVYALTAEGAAVAARIAAAVRGAEVHLPARLAGRVDGAQVEEAPARAAVARLMATSGAIVLVMATGAAVRLAAPHLEDKLRDPAVVAVDDRARFAVPLAGAHAGGGNALARRVAAALGATAIVTTASDGRPWPAPDELARERGWTVEDRRSLAAVTGALLDGAPVAAFQDAGEPLDTAGAWPASLTMLTAVPDGGAGAAQIVVSDRDVPAAPGRLRLRPRTLVLGVGCEAGASAPEIAAAVDRALAEAGLSAVSVAAVATLDRKTAEAGLAQLCAARNWALRGFAAADLRSVAVPTPSAAVEAAVGTPSVCEAAALLGAGAGASLAAPKRILGRVTVAVARRGGGRLSIVGLGPGDAGHVCERALAALRGATRVIGYEPYCAQARSLVPEAPVEAWPIGSEAERASAAVALARAGERVAVVSSGDAGVYGMAALVLDALYDAGWSGTSDPEVEVVPGITAALAAAARLGAPLGVDFACVSLSDLLVPWETIERRLEAAGRGDLVTVLYNPRSRSRPRALARALALLARHRAPGTPAALVHDVCRPGERIEIADLATLDPETAGMTTLVVVGCSTTRLRGRHLITARPRRTRAQGVAHAAGEADVRMEIHTTPAAPAPRGTAP